MQLYEMDQILQKYYDNFDNYIEIPDNIKYGIETVMYRKEKVNIKLLLEKIILTLLGILTLGGGIVFAINYVFNSFELGEGIDTAAKNGYLYTSEEKSDSKERLSGAEIQVSINEFLMDDQNISTNFSFKYNDQLLKDINIESIKRIELKDLIITDENNRILYCANEKALKEFCQTNKLHYEFAEFNDNYFNSGLNSFIKPLSEKEITSLTYNIYSGGLENSYPKSKNLKFKFHEIELVENIKNQGEITDSKIVEGDWECNIEVPEKMYNRQAINYKVVECSDENIEIQTAKISDTGFEFGCIFKNIELPEELKNLREEMKNLSKKEMSDEEMSEMALKFMESDFSMPSINSNYNTNYGETIKDCTYVKNENNEKFLISTNPGRNQKQEFINDDTAFILYETFDITTYDISDELIVHLKFYDKSISVKLKKYIDE